MKAIYFVLIVSIIFAFSLFSLKLVTYDFYTHLFFAKHYHNNWFSLYEPKIGGGFYVYSYPPLIHQLIALLSFIFSYEISGYIVTFIFWTGLSYFSSKFFIEFLKLKEEMMYILFVTVFFSVGVLKTIFIYGQITTIALFAFCFASAYYFLKCLKEEDRKNFIILSLLLALSSFSHVYSFFVLPIMFIFLFLVEFKLVKKKIKPLFVSFLFSAILIVLGLLPLFYNYILGNSLIPAKEIFHESRYPLYSWLFVKRWIISTFGLSATLFFIFPVIILYRLKNHRIYLKLYILCLIFFILGLGYTTFIPKIVFPKIHYWLIYDKFILFSSFLFTPFLLIFFRTKNDKNLTFAIILYTVIWFIVNSWLLASTRNIYFSNEQTYYVDREQAKNYVIRFLNNVNDTEYRYQTFGFGNPINEIYFYSKLSTLDTDYYTGRSIEWINAYGQGVIDSARNTTFILEFLNRSSSYSIKYVISVDSVVDDNGFYRDILESAGWNNIEIRKIGESRLSFWVNPNILSPITIETENKDVTNYLWGVLPLLVLICFLLTNYFFKYVS